MTEDLSVGPLVKVLRKNRGLTQGQLATYAGVERSWLSVLEIGRIERPDREKLESVARVLRVPAETLWAAAGYRVAPLPLRQERTADEILRELHATMPIQVPISRTAVSAGAGAPPEVEYLYYRPAPEERNHRFRAFEVVGTCLEPRIMRGHYIIVDTDASPRPGDIVAVSHDGEAIVKILQEQNGKLYLTALQDQEPIEVTQDTRIGGVVKAAQYKP